MNNQTELFNTRAYKNVGSGFSTSYDPTWDYTEQVPEPPKCVRGQVKEDTIKSVPEHIHWVESYWVKRSGTKHYYYRYCWAIGRKKYRCHIPGGNVNSPLAIYRKLDIEDLITIGESPDKIVEIIKNNFKN